MIYTYMQYFLDMSYYRDTIARLCRKGKEQGITLSADAQRFRQKIRDMGALDLTDKNIAQQIPAPYWHKAIYHNIHLFPEDLNYINNKIRPNPIFDLISSFNTKNLVSLSNIIVFHEIILDDPTIPNGINSVIKAYTASIYDLSRINHDTDKTVKVSDYLKLRRPYIELWFEMVGLTH